MLQHSSVPVLLAVLFKLDAADMARAPPAALGVPEGQDGADLDGVVRVDQDQVLGVEHGHDVLLLALVDGDAGEAALVDGQHGLEGQPQRLLQHEALLDGGHHVLHPAAQPPASQISALSTHVLRRHLAGMRHCTTHDVCRKHRPLVKVSRFFLLHPCVGQILIKGN